MRTHVSVSCQPVTSVGGPRLSTLKQGSA